MTSTPPVVPSTPPAPGTVASVARPLSPVERWYWIADQISPLHGVVRVRAHGPLMVPALRRALDLLQARHPLLRVAIAADHQGREPAFVPVEGRPIPLRHVEVPADDASPDTYWMRELDERELAEPLDWRAGPLVRGLVVTHRTGETGESDEHCHDILLSGSHCVADGMTALALLGQWLALAAEVAGPPTTAVSPAAGAAPATAGGAAPPDGSPSWPARPAAEDLLPDGHRGAAGAARLAGMMARDRWAALRLRPRRIEPDRMVPPEERRTRVLHRALPAARMTELARACKRQGTTVHGALAAAMATAVAVEAGPRPPSCVSIGSPVDFRGELRPPVAYSELGSYAATLPSYVTYRPGALWPMARWISQDLVRGKRRGDHLSMLHLVRRHGPSTVADSGPFLRYLDTEGPLNLCLSNMGRYDVPERVGAWRLSGAQVMANISVTGAVVATAITTHGELAWNFSYVEGAVSRDRAERLAQVSLDAVLDAVATAR
ncbi:phthiocerol/phthiodiolone dimycocerosyl transferase family protein [Streptomyces sp. URMC 123]|uniref:phthiocerol/phthiodiolone dimycocerosyl transferase family protein n=1 Tax=Streptomyces sp. URMC 123 TaxID=3423403 RepID=UPI003F1C6ABE